MRGLTDEERLALAEAREVAETQVPRNIRVGGAVPRRALAARGCWHIIAESPELMGHITPLGELALRVDAAARARGVWP